MASRDCVFSLSPRLIVDHRCFSAQRAEPSRELRDDAVAQEYEVAEALVATETQIAGVESSLAECEETTVMRQSNETGDPTQQIQQLEEQISSLRYTHSLLEELLSKTREVYAKSNAANGHVGPPTVSFGSQNSFSGLQIGNNSGAVNLSSLSLLN